MQGYTFFSPFSSQQAYLVDPCGRLVNRWDRGTLPGLAAHFLENGLMLRTYKVDPSGPFTSASNAGGIELVDWDNNTVWSYEINTPTELSHHDVAYLPNGNLLALVWEITPGDEVIALGRDPTQIAVEGFMWSEKILELEPVGTDSANIVWQWEIKDHYIQDFDSTKANYGVVSQHPELFNINLPDLNSSNSNATRDWNHFNAIDYHPELDQILISVRNSDEIWILDHSTTTTEAASHQGGRYGKGGDILYRWGNAAAYNRGLQAEQKLFGQHGVNWINDGLDDGGKILVFNNGNGRPGTDYSTAEILTPPQDSMGFYTSSPSLPFGPELPEWVYGQQINERLYSPYLSNAQRLANGNTLLNYGSIGTVVEINTQEEIVWKYVLPLNRDFPINQGTNPRNNATFRAYKFPGDFPGFANLDLTAGEPIETNPDLSNCVMLTQTMEDKQEILSIRTYGPNLLLVHNPTGMKGSLRIYNIEGKLMESMPLRNLELRVKLHNYQAGFFTAQVITREGDRFLYKFIRH